MIRTLALTAAVAFGLSSGAALAAGTAGQVTDFAFPHEGPFGSYDQMQLQRGLQVYTEICAACHGLQYVPFRTLGDEGGPALPEDQVRAYAASSTRSGTRELQDFRTATPTDHFPSSSLRERAGPEPDGQGPRGLPRPLRRWGSTSSCKGMGGPEYIASLLTGYTGEEKEEAGVILYENHTFPGGWIAMAPPLWGDDVTYADGSPTDLESVAKDVAAFLMWTAEPKMMARKQAGFTGVLMLSVLAVLLYLTNKRIWAPVKRAAKAKPAE